MIVAVGVEWVDVPRFARALDRFDGRLQERLFSATERAGMAPRMLPERLAARFAAKVAARRALGIAWGSWLDLEVRRAPGARPTLLLRGAAQRRARALGVVAVHLSLSHDARGGLGQVILEGAG